MNNSKSLLESLKNYLGYVRLMMYVIALVLYLWIPITTFFSFVKLFIIALLLLMMIYLYRKANYYNRHYRIPDMICVFSLLNQVGDMIGGIINK